MSSRLRYCSIKFSDRTCYSKQTIISSLELKIFLKSLNVGGQIFMTQISTLTKYPDSLLGVMFNHIDQGMAPMPKTKDGHYFLDVNPLYFGEILDYLSKT